MATVSLTHTMLATFEPVSSAISSANNIRKDGNGITRFTPCCIPLFGRTFQAVDELPPHVG
jgi:hypothetical protein